MMYILYRWLLLFLIGLPIQMICYVLWPLLFPYHLFSRWKLKGDLPTDPGHKWNLNKLKETGKRDPLRDGVFLDLTDDHAALIHGYFWALQPQHGKIGLANLVDLENSTLYRRYPSNTGNPVSGDCLAGWTAAMTYRLGQGMEIPKRHLKVLVNSYIKNCMGLPAQNMGWKVSNRSSNAGMNYTPDSWGGLNQPCLGAQYFTSAGLLKLACKVFGGKYWVVYFLHYWLMGGWLWTVLPFFHTHKDHIYYAQHVTMLGVYSVAKGSWNPAYRWTQWWMTAFLAPRRFINPLFECYRADCGNASLEDIEAALVKCTKFKHVWPQVWTGWINWYNEDDTDHPLTGRFFGVVGGAVQMLQQAKLKKVNDG